MGLALAWKPRGVKGLSCTCVLLLEVRHEQRERACARDDRLEDMVRRPSTRMVCVTSRTFTRGKPPNSSLRVRKEDSPTMLTSALSSASLLREYRTNPVMSPATCASADETVLDTMATAASAVTPMSRMPIRKGFLFLFLILCTLPWGTDPMTLWDVYYDA